jgi:hypothetical protein
VKLRLRKWLRRVLRLWELGGSRRVWRRLISVYKWGIGRFSETEWNVSLTETWCDIGLYWVILG